MASHGRRSYTSFAGCTRQSLARVDKLLRCVLCNRLPHPDYLMVCKNNHFLCGRCAWTPEPFVDGTDNREACCASENLTKKVCPLLSNLMKDSYWVSDYKKNGCETFVKAQDLHINGIESTDCPYFGCKEKLKFGDDTIFHLVEDHGIETAKIGKGKPLVELSISITGSLDGDGAQSGNLTIVEVEYGSNEKYLLTVRMIDNTVYVWVWDFKQITMGMESDTTYLFVLKAFETPWTIQYRDVCAPYWKSSSEVIENANCFALPRDIFMKKYVTQGPAESLVSKMILAIGV